MMKKVEMFRSNDIGQLEKDINDFIYKVTERYDELVEITITTIERKEVIDIKYQAVQTSEYSIEYSALMIYRELG